MADSKDVKTAITITTGDVDVAARYVLAIITICLYAAYCWNINRKRAAVDRTAGGRVHADTDFRDLTDKENPHFRYVW